MSSRWIYSSMHKPIANPVLLRGKLPPAKLFPITHSIEPRAFRVTYSFLQGCLGAGEVMVDGNLVEDGFLVRCEIRIDFTRD